VRSRYAIILLALLGACPAAAQEFRLEEAAPVVGADLSRLKPRTILFNDYRAADFADAGTGLTPFEDWTRVRPAQKQFLSLYPAYAEPTITVSIHGVTKPYKEKLHVYVAEARFIVPKSPAALDLQHYTSLKFIERLDPTIKHRVIGSGDAMPYKDPESAHNRHPDRRWCEGPRSICIDSRYQLEGKLPVGIRLANKLEDSGKKIADYIEFQSEVRLLGPQEVDQAGLARLTGLSTPVTGALEQSIFYVNQMMQFGKFLAVLQEHPTDAGKTVATAFVALGVETDVLEKKKEYENVPVLRNLVPAQVLVGKSSFNTGTSISAGLPEYARNRIRTIAGFLERE
jgi:hypothetical protein